MGADLIGYQTMFPEKFTNEEKEKLLKHLDDIEKLLKTPKLPTLVANEEDANGKYLKQINDIVPDLANDIEEHGYHDDDEEIRYLIESFIELIPDAREFIENPQIYSRDSSSREYNILGRVFVSVFAGELTYGDEPEGQGYETLKNLDKLNLLWVIETMCLPKSKAVHFITSEE